MDLLQLAQDVMTEARRAGADEVEVVIDSGQDFEVTVRGGRIDKLHEAGSRGLGLRVWRGDRQAMASTSDLSWIGIKDIVKDAVERVPLTDPEPEARLPDDAREPLSADGLGLFDEALSRSTADEKFQLALRAEAAALAADPRITRTDGATCATSVGERVLATSRGFAGRYRTGRAHLVATALADDEGGKKRDGHWYAIGRTLAGLGDPEAVGRIAAERAVRHLGARKVRTCEVPVIWDPQTARGLLGIVARAVSGGALWRKSSFLAEREGQAVGSPALTVIDDATAPGRPATRPFDGEGSRSRRNVVFDQGVFRTFLFDVYNARKSGRSGTANASRSAASRPGVGTSNFHIVPGEATPEELIASVRRGLYLTDLIGFGENVTTGDFSRGAAGLWIEDGRLAGPVSEVNVSGHLADMLAAISAVGNDLDFRSGIASPSLRMDRLLVSGT